MKYSIEQVKKYLEDCQSRMNHYDIEQAMENGVSLEEINKQYEK
jgi:hypothetical protein